MCCTTWPQAGGSYVQVDIQTHKQILQQLVILGTSGRPESLMGQPTLHPPLHPSSGSRVVANNKLLAAGKCSIRGVP